jgi:hypothetical protein
LNVPHQESLFAIERGPDKAANQSYPDYLDIRDRSRSFDGVALYNILSVGLDTGNDPEQAWGYEVSGNYFDALEVQPYLGRFFHAGDEHGPNSAPYVVLSYDYWHSWFHEDRAVVGRVVQLNKHPFTILGVAPRAFQGTLLFFFPEIWVPVVNHEQLAGADVLTTRTNRNFIMTFGHLKAGVSKSQAIADLDSVGLYLEKTYPKEDAQMTFALAQPSRGSAWAAGEGVCGRADVAFRADFAGGVRQSREPVCGAGCGPFARGCAASGAGIKPAAHIAWRTH